MSKVQRNGAGRRDPEKLKRQKRRDRLFLAFLTFFEFSPRFDRAHRRPQERHQSGKAGRQACGAI